MVAFKRFANMQQSLHVAKSPGRKLGASVCLLAVLLLWTPLWAAAWQASLTACCNRGLCAAHGGPKSDHPAAPRRATLPLAFEECAHADGGQKHSGLMNCSLSCCQDESNSSWLGSVIFVLPSPAMILRADFASPAPQEISALGLVQPFEPPSPPPRISLLSL